MWIKRFLGPKLDRLAKSRPCIVLSGARQTGKTSLLKKIFPEYRFVTLDLPADAEEAEKAPILFLSKYPPPLVVDEVQYAPGLFRHLKVAIDENRKSYGQFILTGSQKFNLMKEVSDSLAGRVAILELETLSVVEIRASLPTMSVDTILMRGGFPELFAEPALDAFEFYHSYLATYLQRDVRSILNIGNLRDFERFIRACALRSGQLLNKSELARDVGISSSTANEWLSVLAASNQVVLLEPWFSNGTRSIVKSPKLYLNDVGLMLFLLNIRTFQELQSSPYVGAVWETFVFSEIRKRQVFSRGGSSIFFWRDRSKEVDFLIHTGGHFELMECKWTENPTPRDTEGLTHAAQHLRSKNGQSIISQSVICRCSKSFPITQETRAIPVTDSLFKDDEVMTSA
jgi:predicted AAA+ superfamily ATPase